MDLTEELVVNLAIEVTGGSKVTYGELEIDFTAPWRRVRMDEVVAERCGLSLPLTYEILREKYVAEHKSSEDTSVPATYGKMLEEMFEIHVEHTLINPTYVTHYPAEISPLSRRNDEDPEVVDRFELFAAGREIANGFSELNDPVDQASRFEAQADAKAGGDEEAMFFDDDYIQALSYGMPPTAGEGIGIDRLVMLLTNQSSIREVILFPILRSKVQQEES
jgi:lysyl-tRNA synthetase class 2